MTLRESRPIGPWAALAAWILMSLNAGAEQARVDFEAIPSLDGAGVVVSFHVEPNTVYTIESTTDLSSPEWLKAHTFDSKKKKGLYSKKFNKIPGEKAKFFRVTRKSPYTPLGKGDHLIVSVVVLGGFDHDYLSRLLEGLGPRTVVRVPVLVLDGQQLMMTVQSQAGNEIRGYLNDNPADQATLISDGREWHGLFISNGRTFATTTSIPALDAMIASRRRDATLAPWLQPSTRDPNALVKAQVSLLEGLSLPVLEKIPLLNVDQLGDAGRDLALGQPEVDLGAVSLGNIGLNGIDDIANSLGNLGFLAR